RERRLFRPYAAARATVARCTRGWRVCRCIDDYHRRRLPPPSGAKQNVDLPEFRGRPYGLGPRVPMYVISPWSRGGWVDSQVYDHTSVLRLLERRFGVPAPEITPWRR
ncbi:phospholipase, partial [Xanthomonas oryzae pv. oryzae]